MVDEHREDYPSEWAAMTSITGKIGCSASLLSGRHQRHRGGRTAEPAVLGGLQGHRGRTGLVRGPFT